MIVGGGFGGLSAARALARVAVDVTLIDRPNYYLFQSLLDQVATAALAPNTIAAPIHTILRAQNKRTVFTETVTAIDAAGRSVLIGERRIPCNFLIIMTGARHSFSPHGNWENWAQQRSCKIRLDAPSGWPAWPFWSAALIYFLIGFHLRFVKRVSRA